MIKIVTSYLIPFTKLHHVPIHKKIYVCEVCGNEALDEKAIEEGGWITFYGGADRALYVHRNNRVGYEDRRYHFCSINCLVKALESNKSM